MLNQGSDLVEFTSKQIRYWTLQRYLEYCQKCGNYPLCWCNDGASYLPEVMLRICPYESMKKAVKLLSSFDPLEMMLTIGEYEEMQKIVDAKFREKVIRV